MALTKTDLSQIDNLIEARNDDLKDELSAQFRDWRDDFYKKIDPILKEVQANRDERTVMNSKINRNTKRIKKLETQFVTT